MVSRIIVIRHGQSMSNLSPWVPGEPYSDDLDTLTALGVRQAASVADAVGSLRLRAGWQLVSSTDTRARMTAKVISASNGRRGEIRWEPGLVEKDEAEPFDVVLGRARIAIDRWRMPSGDLVCVTHGHVIQTLVADAIGLRADACTSLHPVNGAISVFLNRQLAVFNECGHLRELPHESLFLHPLD